MSRILPGAVLVAPVWSPDGRQIAFVRARQLLLIPRSGGRARFLRTGTDVYPGGISWSPDGTRIAFSGGVGLRTIDVRSGTVTQVTTKYDLQPAWSPDGTQILFRSTVRADGDRNYSHPSWSRDGRRITFEYGHEIDVADRDGSNEHRITRPSAPQIVDARPVWRP
ncbi:MAG: hypothetical protein M3R70_07310 [Actinomycetota bacterium]|nr:hypothetical protein [Actinomycetota bacterium]